MKLYAHPKCTTCKNAIKFLESKKIPFKEVDITKTPPSKAELREMLQRNGGDIRKLFDTSGLQYRALDLKSKLPGMSEGKALELLASNGMLVKRPFVLDKSVGLVGFRKDAWSKAFRGSPVENKRFRHRKLQ